MLNYVDYQNLWNNPAPNGFGQIGTLPPLYHEYVQREIYFQDYLDLFIGVVTYPRINLGGIQYVQITNTNLATLGIAVVVPYCHKDAGIDYIKVDYSYPWTQEQLKKTKFIKYIMIGEAAPSQSPIIVQYDNADKENSFFYNYFHENSTNWLSSPCLAFNIDNKFKKKEKLFELAKKGYLLIDIFPFAINYSTEFRQWLCEKKVTKFFFNTYLIPLIKNVTNYFCNNQSMLAFSGPATSHHYLVKEINNGQNNGITLPQGIICNSNQNEFNNIIQTKMLKGKYLYYWDDGCRLNLSYEKPKPKKGKKTIKYAPIFRCCCYDGSLVGGPNQLFIKNAYEL